MKIPSLLIALLVLLWSIVCVLTAVQAAENHPQQVIDLHFRDADELIPSLEKILENRGIVAAVGHRQLLIKAPVTDLANVKHLIADLDKPPRRLLITVMQTSDVRQVRELLGEDSPGPSVNNRLSRVLSTSSRRDDSHVAQVRVLEGRTALIRVGRTVPEVRLLWVEGRRRHRGLLPSVGLDERELSSGFMVKAHIAGDEVLLQMATHDQKPQVEYVPGRLTYDIATSYSGSLGQWIDLGGSPELTDVSDTPWHFRVRHPDESDLRVLARVELVD